MKYYHLKYVSSLPDGFGGKASLWKIKILEKYRGDKGLLEHEKFHVRCWWYCLAITWLVAAALFFAGTDGWWIGFLIAGPGVHSLLYRIKYFRRLVEVKAYKIQLKAGDYGSPDFAVDALVNKYKLDISEREARELLGGFDDMSFGMRVWDGDGVTILDTDSALLNILGTVTVGPASSGSISIDELPPGQPVYFLEPVDYQLQGKDVPFFPRVSLSGSALSWVYPTLSTSGTVRRIQCTVHYGVF